MAVEKKDWLELKPQYLVNEQGERTAVLLDIEEYRLLLEQIEYEADVDALQHAIENENEFVPLEKVRADFEARRKS